MYTYLRVLYLESNDVDDYVSPSKSLVDLRNDVVDGSAWAFTHYDIRPLHTTLNRSLFMVWHVMVWCGI